MIRVAITLILFISSLLINAQTVKGDWTGLLENGPMKLTVNFHIQEENGSYTSTMDSPDQGAMGIATTSTIVLDNTVTITMDAMKMIYTGTVEGNNITGTFAQGDFKTDMNLTRTTAEATQQKPRAQDPKKPYPYIAEQVTFKNPTAKNIQLAGTLTLPRGIKNPPVAILISGSGPQNRNEEIFNHRPFLILADHLTRQGIAVLRYDDRGVGKSEGTQKDATSADFATDVVAAVNYLKTRTDVNPNKIGLIGHSEGGFIAPMVAAKDRNINFIVLLAGTGEDGKEVLISQTTKAGELAGTPKDAIAFNEMLGRKIMNIVKNNTTTETLEVDITNMLQDFKKENLDNSNTEALTDSMIKEQAKSLSSPWIVYFIKTNPEQFLSKVTCPVLAINGEKDFQVLAKLNLTGIEQSLTKGSNKDITIKELPNLNHLFQTCNTGALEEYATIEETFAPVALELVSDWILAKTK